jgi:hypothetical protein
VQTETGRCHTKGHPEFTLIHDESVTSVVGVPWLTDWLEERVLGGEAFQSGESLQVGWMYDRVCTRRDGTLGILEPDFGTVPVAWVEGVSLTLRHLWFQKEVAASVGLDPAFPSYRQEAIACSKLRGAQAVLMHREQPSHEWDSGWFIGCYEDEHDHQDAGQLVRTSLFEVAVASDQRFIPYAALPVGAYVILGQGPPFISMHDRILEILPGSLLAARRGAYS